ncbi:MAG: GNAT family N-acetyltransferase [Bdellovibrionales bacterium]|nr:GNAT family N-acetyltransferase [Bdellovibrionales bacterium]
MSEFGEFEQTASFDGKEFRVESVGESYLERVGFPEIIAVDGVPAQIADELVRSAQVCDVPHTWCVKRLSSIEEVTPEILARGKKVLEEDRDKFGSRIFCYVGIRGDEKVFLAAGAIRDKLTQSFYNPSFPVVSRAVVSPQFRGKGLGSLIVEHRMEATLRYFDVRPKAIHFATESPQILHSVRKFEKKHGFRFLYIGDERYSTEAGTFSVNDYLCPLPDYKESLFQELSQFQSELPVGFAERFECFLREGSNGVSGDALADEINSLCVKGVTVPLLQEFFLVRKTIGARDPDTHDSV